MNPLSCRLPKTRLFSLMRLNIVCFLVLAVASSSAEVNGTSGGKTALAREQVQVDSGEEVLDNEAVVRMVREKLSVRVILNAIGDNPGHYSVTSGSLIRLKAAGVPETIIEAMQAKARGSASEDAVPAEGPEACVTTSRWIPTPPRRDVLTDALFVEASSAISLAGACVRVKASCYTDPKAQRMADAVPTQAKVMQGMQVFMQSLSKDAPTVQSQPNVLFDARTLEFQFQYLPKPGSGLALLSHVRSNAQCVVMRVRVDDSRWDGVQSHTCDIADVSSIRFPAMHLRDVVQRPSGDGNGFDQTMGKLLSGLQSQGVDAMESGSTPPLATMQEVIGSKEVLVELPLSDGSSTAVPIHPQDPTFRQFASACLEAFPDPPKPESQQHIESLARPMDGRPASSSPDVIAQPMPSKSGERTLRLTREHPSEARTAMITAPGRGLQNFNIFYIDTRDFAAGTLVIDIDIPGNSATDGSFDLFPSDVPIPVQGPPAGTLAGSYDVRKGASTRITYRFHRGRVFALGLEGNWFSPKGATGLVQFRASAGE